MWPKTFKISYKNNNYSWRHLATFLKRISLRSPFKRWPVNFLSVMWKASLQYNQYIIGFKKDSPKENLGTFLVGLNYSKLNNIQTKIELSLRLSSD